MAVEASQPSEVSQPKQPLDDTDSRLAAILAKKEAGQPLTHSERGYLGVVRRKSKPRQVSQPADGNPLFDSATATPPPADNPLFEAESPAGAVAEAPTAQAYPPERLRAGANSILSSVDWLTKLIIGWQAKEAGGDKQTVQTFKQAVALKDEQREMIVEGSDEPMQWLCDKLGCEPEEIETKFKGGKLVAGLGGYGFGIAKAVKLLIEARKENDKRKQQAKQQQENEA